MPSVALTLTANSTNWTNYTGALTSNNNRASYPQGAGGGVSFNFSTNATTAIPADQIITGVVITIEGYCSPAQPNSITIIGTPEFDTPISFTTTDTVHTRGSPSNTLGFTNAASLADVTFRFGNDGTASTTFYIDNVTITVHYDKPPASNALFFGENF